MQAADVFQLADTLPVFVFLPDTHKDMVKLFDNDDKQIIIKFCEDYIAKNGYVTLGWATNESIKDKHFDGDGHKEAFYNSVSSMLVNSGKYIREPNKQVKGDWDILLNSSYYLNESVISTNKITRFIAIISLLIALLTLIKDLTKSDKIQVPQLQETNKQLQMQQKTLDSLLQILKKRDNLTYQSASDTTSKN